MTSGEEGQPPSNELEEWQDTNRFSLKLQSCKCSSNMQLEYT